MSKHFKIVVIFLCLYSLIYGRTVAEAVEYKGGSFRDPFVSLKPEAPKERVERSEPVNLSAYRLQGIAWSAERPRAILNGKVVKKGDVIDGAVVSEILTSSVELVINGEKHTLNTRRNV